MYLLSFLIFFSFGSPMTDRHFTHKTGSFTESSMVNFEKLLSQLPDVPQISPIDINKDLRPFYRAKTNYVETINKAQEITPDAKSQLLIAAWIYPKRDIFPDTEENADYQIMQALARYKQVALDARAPFEDRTTAIFEMGKLLVDPYAETSSLSFKKQELGLNLITTAANLENQAAQAYLGYTSTE